MIEKGEGFIRISVVLGDTVLYQTAFPPELPIRYHKLIDEKLEEAFMKGYKRKLEEIKATLDIPEID